MQVAPHRLNMTMWLAGFASSRWKVMALLCILFSRNNGKLWKSLLAFHAEKAKEAAIKFFIFP